MSGAVYRFQTAGLWYIDSDSPGSIKFLFGSGACSRAWIVVGITTGGGSRQCVAIRGTKVYLSERTGRALIACFLVEHFTLT